MDVVPQKKQSFAMPFNLKQWIEDNQELLKPPVSNKCIYTQASDFIVMIVGGPNARKDFHYEDYQELFYQLKGDITVYVQSDGKKVAIEIKQGEMFLLPGNIPHSPSRPADTIGLVIQRVRMNTGCKDGLHWYCEKCNNKLYQVYFPCVNIQTDFLPHFKHFYGSEELRTCKLCKHVMDTDPSFI